MQGMMFSNSVIQNTLTTQSQQYTPKPNTMCLARITFT